MRISMLILALAAGATEIKDMKWIDSDINPKITYLVVDDCPAPILKAQLNDLCYVDRMVWETCQIKTGLGAGCD